MEICRVCRRYSNQPICPHCGYQSVIPTILNEEIDNRLNELADKYRNELLGNLKIYVKIYAYELTGDGLDFKEERKLLLVDTSDFSGNHEIWNEQVFGTTEDLELTVYVELKDVVHTYNIALPVPENNGGWFMGVNISRDLFVRVMVGESGNCSVSEPIDLLGLNGE